MGDDIEYPTKGVQLIVPPTATLRFVGWGVRFERRGKRYEVRYLPSGLSIERDGKRVARWDDVPAAVQKIIVKVRDTHGAAFAAGVGA